MESIIGDRQRILVRQTKEWGEILLGFETRNKFDLMDEGGAVIGHVAEEAGGFGALLGRQFLGHCRACTVHVYDAEGHKVGEGRKPFRWFFHRMEVTDTAGRPLGAIQRRWSLVHRTFTVENAQGQDVLTIQSPWLRIWTFKLLFQGQEIGRITKQWGGLLREWFTDADTFGVDFGTAPLPAEVKKLLLLATFLIDFTCFENNQKNRGGVLWGDQGW
jgi:uncharacterized protein YxjI